jgi:hypothetical protein
VLFRIIAALIVGAPAILPLCTPQAQQSYQTSPTQDYTSSGNKFSGSITVRHSRAADDVQPKPAEKTQKDGGQKESPIDNTDLS